MSLGKFVKTPSTADNSEFAPVQGFASATDTSDTQVIAAPGAGYKLLITCVVVYNANSSSGTGVLLKSNSTTKWGPIPAPSGKGGCVIPLEPPLTLNENEALKFATQDAVTTVTVSAVGYKGTNP